MEQIQENVFDYSPRLLRRNLFPGKSNPLTSNGIELELVSSISQLRFYNFIYNIRKSFEIFDSCLDNLKCWKRILKPLSHHKICFDLMRSLLKSYLSFVKNIFIKYFESFFEIFKYLRRNSDFYKSFAQKENFYWDNKQKFI